MSYKKLLLRRMTELALVMLLLVGCSVPASTPHWWVITASSDNTARVWDAMTGKIVAELDGHTSPVITASHRI